MVLPDLVIDLNVEKMDQKEMKDNRNERQQKIKVDIEIKDLGLRTNLEIIEICLFYSLKLAKETRQRTFDNLPRWQALQL